MQETHADSAAPLRRLFRRQVFLTAAVLASLLGVVGMLTLLIAFGVDSREVHEVLVEVGVSLMLFGMTTLFVTVAVSKSLDRSLQVSISEILTSHNAAVLKLTADTQKAVEQTAEQIKPLGGNWRSLGLTNVYLTRADALAEFGSHLREELQRAGKAAGRATAEQEARETFKHETPKQSSSPEPKATDTAVAAQPLDGVDSGKATGEREIDIRTEVLPQTQGAESLRPRLWIAASSMKGLLEAASVKFDGLGMFTWAAELARDGKLDLRVLLTHPKYARLRATQEGRGPKAIPEEIEEALKHLQRSGVPVNRVRMVATPPTVFAIATRDQMLLNPYPYSQEAYRSFTLTVRRSHPELSDHSAINRDIFEQYVLRHFELPWYSAKTLLLTKQYGVPELENDPLLPEKDQERP